MKKEKHMDEQKGNQGEAVPPAAKEDVRSGVSHAQQAADDLKSAASAARDEVQQSVTHARRAAEDLKSAAGAVAGEYRGRAEEVWNDARYRVRSFQEDSEEYVRENPTKSVFTALAIGFVLGLIFRR